MTKHKGVWRLVAIHDITCAFLHASMEGEPPVYLVLPPGMGPPGCRGHLRCALYGTRRASFLWGEKVATVFSGEGFLRSKTCGQVFWHPTRHLESTIHGDDLLTVGSEKELAWFDTMVNKHFSVKEATVLGEGPKHVLRANFLNRTIELVRGKGFTYTPNARHIDEVVEELGLTTAKPVAAPAIQHTGPSMRESADELEAEDAALYARCTGKLV